MASKIPDGITADHVERAVRELESGAPHEFGESTRYDVVVGGRRYPPKAVIGIAAGLLTGDQLGPYDFSAGLETKCFRTLRDLGFDIVLKGGPLRYWWVNQNQTFKEETEGGYMWSPKRKKNGARNYFYDAMREVQPGDLVFSFNDTRISVLGRASSHCYESSKPQEFGAVGSNWGRIGWRVDVMYTPLKQPIRPKDHMEVLAPLLPEKYAPLQQSGDGLQSVYLTEVPQPLADALLELAKGAGNNIGAIVSMAVDTTVDGWDETCATLEDQVELEVKASGELSETDKEQLVKSRRGQGKFRKNVQSLESACRVTGVTDLAHLRASHIKPWRWSSNEERLDGANGLLLTPDADHLFDRGFISFTDSGELLISPTMEPDVLVRLGIEPTSVVARTFSSQQRSYLAYHRREVFLSSES